MSKGTTIPGYVNSKGQMTLRLSSATSNHYNQRLFEMKCGTCGNEYLSNGSDIHIRKCPKCQGGKPSSEAK